MIRSEAERIDAWLRAACARNDDRDQERERDARDGVDMSADAITHRIMELAAMASLCLDLGEVGKRQRARR